jgi:spoIIIJ-associated protein
MAVPEDLRAEIVSFVESVVGAMGLQLRVAAVPEPEALQIDLDGEDGGVLTRRGGEGLQALQHLLATAFRRQLGEEHRVVIDCMGFRREKDAELRKMARFTAEKALSMGAAQELGPLNPYERRLVHLTVSEMEGVSSESVGDAFLKTVIISARP